ncbi:glutamine--fructose-6-phosphate aminotransferase, partial [Gordonibacter urolithinfaciens]|nr:glutamine--fructose-6-phosphate aminotransferase [Gordonibacter urolithinfaciens]
EAAKLTPAGIRYFGASGEEVYDPKVTHVDWDVDVAEKGGYPDFMMKEIHEQPRVIRDTLAGRLVDGHLAIDELDLS